MTSLSVIAVCASGLVVCQKQLEDSSHVDVVHIVTLAINNRLMTSVRGLSGAVMTSVRAIWLVDASCGAVAFVDLATANAFLNMLKVTALFNGMF